MRVTMFWQGGSSYATFDTNDAQHAEQFDSIKDAMRAFGSRSNGQDTYYPCVSEDSPEDGGPEAWLFLCGKKDAIGQDYPDRIMRFGPRGGVVVEQA